MHYERKAFYPVKEGRYGKPAPSLRFDGNRPPRDLLEEHYVEEVLFLMRVLSNPKKKEEEGMEPAQVLPKLSEGERDRFARALLDAAFYGSAFYWASQRFVEVEVEKPELFKPARKRAFLKEGEDAEDEFGAIVWKSISLFAQSYYYHHTKTPPYLSPQILVTQGAESLRERVARGELIPRLRDLGYMNTVAFFIDPKEALTTPPNYREALDVVRRRKWLFNDIAYRRNFASLIPPYQKGEGDFIEETAKEMKDLCYRYEDAIYWSAKEYAARGLDLLATEFLEKGYIEVPPEVPRFAPGFPDTNTASGDLHNLRYLGRFLWNGPNGEEPIEVWETARDFLLDLGEDEVDLLTVKSKTDGPPVRVLLRRSPFPHCDPNGSYKVDHWMEHGSMELVLKDVYSLLNVESGTFADWHLSASALEGRDIKEELEKQFNVTRPDLDYGVIPGKPPEASPEDLAERIAAAHMALAAFVPLGHTLAKLGFGWGASFLENYGPSYALRKVSMGRDVAEVTFAPRFFSGAPGVIASYGEEETTFFSLTLPYPEGFPLKTRGRFVAVGPKYLGEFLDRLREEWPEYYHLGLPMWSTMWAFYYYAKIYSAFKSHGELKEAPQAYDDTAKGRGKNYIEIKLDEWRMEGLENPAKGVNRWKACFLEMARAFGLPPHLEETAEALGQAVGSRMVILDARRVQSNGRITSEDVDRIVEEAYGYYLPEPEELALKGVPHYLNIPALLTLNFVYREKYVPTIVAVQRIIDQERNPDLFNRFLDELNVPGPRIGEEEPPPYLKASSLSLSGR